MLPSRLACLAGLALLVAGCSHEASRDIEATAEAPAPSSSIARSNAPAAAPVSASPPVSVSAKTPPPVRPGCIALAASINPQKNERFEIEGLLTERRYTDPSFGPLMIMVLRPPKPVCVLNASGALEAETVKEFQVFESEAAEPGLAGSLTRLTSHRVVLGGGLIPRFTAHHATDFLIAAMDVRAAPKGPPPATSVPARGR